MKQGRRFGILDLMLLIGATAVGLAALQLRRESFMSTPSLNTFQVWLLFLRDSVLVLVGSYLIPFLAPWTLATLALSLRRPRPPLRKLLRSPGFAAMFGAGVGFALVAPFGLRSICWLLILPAPTVPIEYLRALFPADLYSSLGPPILTALLFVSPSRIRPAPTWIDRLGWGIGICWLALWATDAITLYLMNLPF